MTLIKFRGFFFVFIMVILNLLPTEESKAKSYSLRITDNSDNSILFNVDDSLELEVAQDMLLLKSAQNRNEFHLEDIKGINYEAGSSLTGISLPDAMIPRIYITSDSIVFYLDTEEETPYSLYNLSGVLINEGKIKNEGRIDLSVIFSGTYLLKIGSYPSLKIVVK